MSKIKAIIVDDELSARENLTYLVENFCAEITILDACCDVDSAVQSINKYKPNVVFLDIEMPQKNGFQLINEFSEINFQIIFITAYDQYAIKAFEVSAVDYLLKPVDIDRLIEAIERVKLNIDKANYEEKLETLDNNKKGLTKLTIPHKNDHIIIDIDSIICIEADRMYSNIYVKNGNKYTASKKLSYYEDIFNTHDKIKRIHRSWIVNLAYLESYSLANRELTINGKVVPYSKTYKNTIESLLT